ncbi:ubiquinone biosynthesis accessory factor UbiK [Oceanisphaera psychrotolerans]|uniref:Ubiquinone biosynthesis accessory factor UbiK n=1 Tax=Oceanisphaera psychrotolerans TaxID=1414654 RepID=A0A1J4QEA7_9GAMM|nr:accessory factor UbiK family protein [Oceanisphaera psychrotolerans]OIN07102.1 cytoplasmic protein [Oceanisphaera psychrotolerans]
MLDPKKLEDIAKQIQNNLPSGLKNMGEEAEKRIRTVLQAQLGKLDMVTREEFDVQTKVLLRTREKLNEMETKLALLERRLADSQDEQG